MNIASLTEWHRRQGHHILTTASNQWVSSGAGTYQVIPYHALPSPKETELEHFFNNNRITALRYSTPLSEKEGAMSYHVVYDSKEYPLENLPKKARHDVKKGLSIAKVEPISFSHLATAGWELRFETLVRQGRTQAESKSWWNKLCLSADGLDGFEAWGASVDGNLAAALLGMQYEDTFCIFYQQSRTDFLRFGVNNALTYVVTAEVLKRPGINQVFYGLHSLDAPASVDEFKFRMGYRPKPVRQRVVFSPFLRPFVNKISYALLQTGTKLYPNSHLLSKAEGMFRFYLNGKLPPESQDIPSALSSAYHDLT